MTRPFLPGRAFAAFLFDMDGTILSSIAAAERVWGAWGRRHGLDLAEFLPTIHGMRTVETIRRLALPGVDPETEAVAITRLEMEDLDGVDAVGGAAHFLGSLPPDRWAIVTSAPRALALRRLEAAALPLPTVLVTAEDVQVGKPAPDGYLLAASRLRALADNCLVFEDAPAGITAAEAAGAAVVVVTATHTTPSHTTHPQIRDYQALAVRMSMSGRLELQMPA